MTIPIPAHMRGLPRDKRGLPITFTSVLLPDGRYDFTTADPTKWAHVTRNRLCALCGQPMPKKVWFIGGPKCMHFRFFFDPGMHEECARYSLVACPYIAMPNYYGAKKRLVPELYREELVSADKEKPEAFGLACTDGYTVEVFQGDRLVRAKRWIRPVEWWKDGARIDYQPAMPPVRTKVGAA